jgi:hypothetical protein
MNILHLLHKDKLDSLGYDSIYLEKPIPNIAQDIDWKNILENPPANISKTTLQELQLLSRLTIGRTEDQKRLVLNIDKDMDTPFELLCKSYGVNYPKSLIDAFYDIVRPILLNTKAYYNRPRPNQLSEYFNLKIDVIVTDTHHTASYPSGHTVYTKLVSLILKSKHPQIDQNKLDNIVNTTAKARMLQGVHYPSDNQASLVFSTALFNYLTGILK